MKIVIDIPEEMYQEIKETNMVISGRRNGKRIDYILFNAVDVGIPLPKGHGELKDADAMINKLCTQEASELFGSTTCAEIMDFISDEKANRRSRRRYRGCGLKSEGGELMKIVIDIPDNEIPTQQDIISVELHCIDGKIFGCNYPIEELPKKGKWIVISCEPTDIFKCSECGMRVINPYRYCHSCGTKMEVELK